MLNIKVNLLHHTPINIAVKGIRRCWDSECKMDSTETELGQKDSDLIKRVVNEFKHESTIEHIFFNFEIRGISRLCLQELARHRMASYSVKSTRYTLKELRGIDDISNPEIAKKYIVMLKDCEPITNLNPDTIKLIDEESIKALAGVHKLVNSGIRQDGLKYALPECYRTSLNLSINARALKNFLELRLSKAAHFEIRYLASLILHEILKTDTKILFQDFIVSED